MQKNGILLLAFLLTAFLFAPSVHAEELNDSTINQVYAEMKDAIRDTAKLTQVMNNRLDDSFRLISTVTRTIGTNPPQTIPGNMTKQQFIDDTVKDMAMMKLDNYESTIKSIHYSEDKKYATVSDVTTSSGMIDMSAQQGAPTNIKFGGQESCSDTLVVTGGVVKLIQSRCNDQVVLNQQAN